MPDDNAIIYPDERELIEKLRLTSRCQEEISETSHFFTGLSGDRFAALAQHLIRSGESNPLGILMNITAIIGVKLPSRILADTLKIIEPIIDFHIPYRLQDASAIEPLLDVVEMEELNEKLRLANELARQRMKELQEKERELESLTTNLQKAKEAPSDHKAQKRAEPVVSGEAERKNRTFPGRTKAYPLNAGGLPGKSSSLYIHLHF